MTATSTPRPRRAHWIALIFGIVGLVGIGCVGIGCVPSKSPPNRGAAPVPSPTPQEPSAPAERPERPSSAPKPMPPGWVEDCEAASASAAYQEYRRHELPEEDFTPPDSIAPPKSCAYTGDFDGDGLADSVTWVRRQDAHEAQLAVRWGSGAVELVGAPPHGRIAPWRGREACAITMWHLAEMVSGRANPIAVQDPSALGNLRHEGDVLVFDRMPAIVLGYRHGTWQWLRLDNESKVPPKLESTPRESTPPAPACAKATRLRRAALNEMKHAQGWATRAAVGVRKQGCETTGDFDGDGEADRVDWVVEDGHVGLRLTFGNGEVEIIGGSGATVFEVATDEPGCNGALRDLATVAAIDVAPWNGQAFTRPGDTRLEVAHPLEVEGDALVLTRPDGHEDLFFRSNGGWRQLAAPFDWTNTEVLWPYHGEWMRILPPVPARQAYDRPVPPSARVLEHDEPPPVPPGRVYIGH